MQEDTLSTNQQPDGELNGRLWTWEFETIDWIGVTSASLLFVAYVTFLFLFPEVIDRYGMITSAPLFSGMVLSAGFIIRPRSNTTRIPAIYLILLSAIAIFINWSLL